MKSLTNNTKKVQVKPVAQCCAKESKVISGCHD